MNARKLRNPAAAIAILLAPSAALAQGFTLEAAPEKEPEVIYMNEVEIGVGYTDIDSFKFGEYTGIEDDGPFPIANFNLMRRPAYDSNETPRYWRLEGNNLGIDSRSVHGEYGVQGNYELSIDYQQIPHFKSESGRTPFIGAGGTLLTLPPTWVPSTTTAGMTNLLPSLRGFDVETERKNVGLGGIKYFGKRWKFGADFHHDTKEGIDTIGASFGVNGGNPRAMILPKPVDYETNRVNIFAEYTDRKSVLRFSYELSAFTNDAPSVRFRQPYTAITVGNAWPAGAVAGFSNPNAFGELALEPDNIAHSFSLSGARTVGKTSRVSANFTHTRYEQDERFLPYSANTDLVVTTPLPRNSLDGEISTTIFDLGFTSRPMRKLDVAARYRFEKRENDTPLDTFIYIIGDSENQPAAPGGGNARINLPYGSGDTHKVKLDGGYRVMPRAKVSLGYEFEQRQRDFAEVDKTREHTVSGKLSLNPIDTANGWIKYARSVRDGSSYRDNLLFLASHPNSLVGFENDPLLRKSNLADRDRDEVRGVVNVFPDPRFSVTFDSSFRNDDYSKTAIGLTKQRMASFTVDFGVNPREDVSAHAFATYENLRGEQNGCSWAPGGACVTSPPSPVDSWNTEIEDRVWTFGLGADWQVNNRLGVGTNISFSRALTETETTSVGLATLPLPDIISRWYSLGVYANYKLKKNLEARLGYSYERLKTDDFAIDNVAPNTLANVITLGEMTPNYSGHVVGLALSYKF